jgi:hypothetical protein
MLDKQNLGALLHHKKLKSHIISLQAGHCRLPTGFKTTGLPASRKQLAQT